MKTSTLEALGPEEQIARLQSASNLLREGRRPEAIAGLRVLTVMAPANVDAKRLLGVALNETGDCPGAEAAFRAALALKPNEANIVVGLVEALIAQKKGDEAVEALEPFVNEQTSNFVNFSPGPDSPCRAPGARRTLWPCSSARCWCNPTAPWRATISRAPTPTTALMSRLKPRRRERAPSGWRRRRCSSWKAAPPGDRAGCTKPSIAFAEAVRRRPTYTLAAVELAETIWLATGDAEEAFGVYDEAAKVQDPDRDLSRHKAKLQEEIGDQGRSLCDPHGRPQPSGNARTRDLRGADRRLR